MFFSVARASLLLLIIRCSCAARDDGACANAVSVGDPVCTHGGTLHSENVRQPVSCSKCDCPDALWAGVDCSICRGVEACPARDGLPAHACSAALIPTLEELASPSGKVLSCACGGDEATEQLCTLLPETRVRVVLTGSGGGLAAALRLYAGMPSQLVQPTATHFAYPSYWTANFTGCGWTERECIDPLPSKSSCLFFEARRWKKKKKWTRSSHAP